MTAFISSPCVSELVCADPRKWKATTINGVPTIATTDNSGYFSVFTWNAKVSQFVLLERVALESPQELCFFQMFNDTYLAVCPTFGSLLLSTVE